MQGGVRVVFAVTATRRREIHLLPSREAVSPENVTPASFVPVADHTEGLPMCETRVLFERA